MVVIRSCKDFDYFSGVFYAKAESGYMATVVVVIWAAIMVRR